MIRSKLVKHTARLRQIVYRTGNYQYEHDRAGAGTSDESPIDLAPTALVAVTTRLSAIYFFILIECAARERYCIIAYRILWSKYRDCFLYTVYI